MNPPVDARALYECPCCRQHGKWAIFNGVVDDREALTGVNNNRTLSSATNRRRQEAAECIWKEAHDSQRAAAGDQN